MLVSILGAYSLTACNGETKRAGLLTCDAYHAQTAEQKAAFIRRIYAGTVRVLRSETNAIDNKTTVANLQSAPARPSDRMVQAMAADEDKVCSLHNAHPEIELGNAYLVGKVIFPAH